MGLDEEKSLPWTIAALRRAGYKIDEPEGIVDVVDSLNSDLPDVAIRVKNGFGNLDGLWEAKGEDTFEGDVPAEEEEAVESVEDVEEEVVEEEPVTEEAEAQVEIGTKVSFDWKGESLEGEVKEIDEAEGKLKVKVGTKVYPVKAENATIVAEEISEEDEEVVEEEPEVQPEPVVKKKAAAKKPAPKPVKKNVKRK